MIWHKFKALGTEIIITALVDEDGHDLLMAAEKEIHNFEQIFSRFIPGNELSKFNDSGLGRREVSEPMLELLREARRYYLETHGIFDPTIISSLEALGYDKSFEKIDVELSEEMVKMINWVKFRELFSLRPKMSELKIEGNIVSCPKEFKLDFGGIGKGYIADIIGKKFFHSITDYWIDAGGDISVSGNQSDLLGWDINVQDPYYPDETIFTINTRGKKLGVSTSGIIKRKGVTNGYKWNHLIDPRTGLSVENNILSVTVISSNATRADIFAKTVLILGEEKGLQFIEDQLDSACIIFTKEKEQIFSKRADLYLKK